MSDLSRRRSRRKPRKPKNKRRPNLLFYFVVALFFTMAVLGFKMADALFEPVTTKADVGPTSLNIENPIKEKAPGEPINILIIGTDERENEPSRSDTLILASLFPEDKQIKMLSIPRDTRVKIPGRGYEKVSHAHAYGQVALAQKTVEDFLDVHIDYYVKTNFQGFVNIIDILGGVTLNVEKRMYYPDENIDLQPGLQNLNGDDALAYVRFRSDGLGDIGRVGRQQKFLSVLADHVKSFATIPKIPSLIKQINTHVKTDMSTKDILYYASKFITIDPSSIQTYMVPGYPDNRFGTSYWISDKEKLAIILDEMKEIKD